MDQLEHSIHEVNQRITQACQRTGRNPQDITVVAVTKYASFETTKSVLEHGLGHIGESKIQAALPKWMDLQYLHGVWHFIGHLQTNKVKEVIGRFQYIHSLDRIALAEEIEKRGRQQNVVTSCFVQVNVAEEDSKFGMNLKEVLEFVKRTSKMEYIRICGLMTMAPFVEDPEETRTVFRSLREIRDEIVDLKLPNISQLHLSMGMSNDFEVAIEEGADFIRLGTVLVGNERNGR
jgi:PLP dependent protein